MSKSAANDFRAVPHAGDATAGALATEACAVVTHADIDVLARGVQSGFHPYAGRVSVLHDVGEGLLQDA